MEPILVCDQQGVQPVVLGLRIHVRSHVGERLHGPQDSAPTRQ